MSRTIPALATLTLLAACGSPAPEGSSASRTVVNGTVPAQQGTVNSPVTQQVADATAAPVAFNQCKMCHAVARDAPHGIGPNLFGVYGTKSGSVAGYTFSPAFKAWGATLDDATLDAYLAAPQKTVPGTKMAFAGLPDPAQRKAVIDYLKTLK